MKRTLVTAIYYTTPTSRMGGRGYTFQYYEAPFRNILNLDCNIVVYTYGSESEKIRTFFEKYNFTDFKIIDYDLNLYANSNKIYELKESFEIIDSRGLQKSREYANNDRCHHLCLSKLFFLKNAIDNQYFTSDQYYWIDAGLFHHGIFPETYGGIEKFVPIDESKYWPSNKRNVCTPETIKKLDEYNKTGMIFLGLNGIRHALPYWWSKGKYSQIPFITHIVGGLFGGDKDIVLNLYEDFNKISEEILNSGALTLEEHVLSLLFGMKYHIYKYILFESWYHDIPTDPNYFGIQSSVKSFYKIFI